MDFFIALIALLLGVLSIGAFITGLVFVVIMIVKANSDKPTKKYEPIVGWSIGVSILSFILMFALAIISPGDEPTTTPTTSSESSNTETQSDEEEESQSAADSFADSRKGTKLTDEEKEEREESAQEYKEEQAEKEEKAESEEVIEDETEEENDPFEDIKFNHEVVDGIDVFTDFTEMLVTPNNYMSNFSIEMSNLLNDIHDDLDNGVIFRNAATITDSNGNDTEIILVNVWYTQDTVERINYDNWPQLIGEDLYNAADAVTIHTVIGNDVDVENKRLTDEVPNIFTDSIGAPYEEDE